MSPFLPLPHLFSLIAPGAAGVIARVQQLLVAEGLTQQSTALLAGLPAAPCDHPTGLRRKSKRGSFSGQSALKDPKGSLVLKQQRQQQGWESRVQSVNAAQLPQPWLPEPVQGEKLVKRRGPNRCQALTRPGVLPTLRLREAKSLTQGHTAEPGFRDSLYNSRPPRLSMVLGSL